MDNEIDKLFTKIIDGGYEFGTGVWAFINENIGMKLNKFGEYIPYIKNSNYTFSKEEYDLLQQVCLTICSKNESDVADSLYKEIPNIHYNKRIGYYLGLYVGHVREGDFRVNASSGGLSTWILKELMEQGYVDGVIHVKESQSEDKIFEFNVSKNIDEIIAGAKTRYYPVEMSEVLRLVENTPGRYAIIGLPSYIMSIRLLADVNPVIKERIKYTLGLVCGHQKSSYFADFLAWQCGIEPGNLKTINFRKKLLDEPANAYGIEVTGIINGKEVTVTEKMKNIFGGDWGQGLFKVRASDFTDDVMNETADVALGDAWLPEYTQDSMGNNIIIIRNPIIKKIIDDGIRDEKLSLDKVDESTIYRSQLSHYKHTQDELGYRLYKKDSKEVWRPTKRIQPNSNINYIRKKIQDKREEICLKAPTYYNEAVKRNDISYFTKKMTPLVNSYKNLYRIEKWKKKLLKRY